jgi:capsular polysaccharide biosynthesis protein
LATVPNRYVPVLSDMGRRADLQPKTNGPERLYLARKPHLWTKLLNHEAIEAVAVSRGFTVIHAEEHSFEWQVSWVRNARFVLGPVGSQLFITFFARPGTKLCYLTHPFTIESQSTFYPLAAMGIDVTMLLGRPGNLNNAPEHPTFGFSSHADYEIDPDVLAGFLDEWLDA